MKVLGIAGSMRKGRNTDALVNAVVNDMSKLDASVEAQVIRTADLTLHPCRVLCHEANCSAHRFRCSIEDSVGDVVEEMMRADALVIGAPHYFRGPPAGFHTLIERLQSMAFFHESAGNPPEESPLLGKPCGLIGVCEYSNPQVILEYLHDFCMLLGMDPIRLGSFPYLGVGTHGDVEQDEIFRPLDRSKELASRLVEAVRARD